MNNYFNDDTPICTLTLGQLKKALKEETSSSTQQPEEKPKKFVYGLRGIRNLFNVSPVTARKYKDTILKPAIMQNARTIVVDVDLALECFKNASDNQ